MHTTDKFCVSKESCGIVFNVSETGMCWWWHKQWSEEIHRIQSGYPLSWSGFEPSLSEMQV
jgi:hypothetical protein